MKTLTVKVDGKLIEKLDEVSEMCGHNRSDVIRYALERFAEENSRIRGDSFRQIFLRHAVAK